MKSARSTRQPAVSHFVAMVAFSLIAVCLTGAGAYGNDASTEQVRRGKSAFQTNCTNGCHEADLRPAAVAPALSGKIFLQHWQGLGANELFERIRSTMPQQKPRSLSDQTYVDILAFILHQNAVALGDTELQNDPDQLSGLIIKPIN